MTDFVAAEWRHRLSRLRRGGAGLVVLPAGCVATVGTYAWILRLQSEGRSAAALDMPDMGMIDVDKYWAFPVLQAAGLMGLLFAYLAVVIGLAHNAGNVRGTRWIPVTPTLHRQIGLLVVGLVLVHVVATVFDAMGNTWKAVLIPGQAASTGWPEAEWGFNTGIFAFYLLLLTGPTFYLRRLTGVRRWRSLHGFVLAFYVLALWHTLILGLDVSYYHWIRPGLWLAQIPLLVLLIARLRGSTARHYVRRSALARWAITAGRHVFVAASMAGIVGIVLILITGSTDFIRTI
jgi:methionine sulfoxide reductase heme-binding subunit